MFKIYKFDHFSSITNLLPHLTQTLRGETLEDAWKVSAGNFCFQDNNPGILCELKVTTDRTAIKGIVSEDCDHLMIAVCLLLIASFRVLYQNPGLFRSCVGWREGMTIFSPFFGMEKISNLLCVFVDRCKILLKIMMMQ